MINTYKFKVSYQNNIRVVSATKSTQINEAQRSIQNRVFVVEDNTLRIDLDFIKEAFNNVQ